MNKVAIRLCNGLTLTSKSYISTHLQDRQSNPIKERVMSTPTWPVPYYQRIHRAYPVREDKNINLSTADLEFSDVNWYSAKEALNRSLKGRQIVQYTENNVRTNSTICHYLAYQIRKEDCETMARSYVSDISQFLDIANRENVKILAGKTLI